LEERLPHNYKNVDVRETDEEKVNLGFGNWV